MISRTTTYLWRSSEVDDAVHLDLLAELGVQPAVPVLVDGPLFLRHTAALIEVGCKDVPEGVNTVRRKERSHSPFA